jgi:hypothetical protein
VVRPGSPNRALVVVRSASDPAEEKRSIVTRQRGSAPIGRRHLAAVYVQENRVRPVAHVLVADERPEGRAGRVARVAVAIEEGSNVSREAGPRLGTRGRICARVDRRAALDLFIGRSARSLTGTAGSARILVATATDEANQQRAQERAER